MGQQDAHPTRPKNTWTVRDPPWTDGRGNTELYHASVLQWCKYHDLLPDTHAQKVPQSVRGLVLQGQLYGRAVDLVAALPQDVITSPDGAYAIANSIHKFDPLSATTEAYQSFLSALSCVRGSSETFLNFESRFEAAVCKARNASGSVVVMPDVFWAFMLLSNARVDPAHKVSILARLAGKGTSSPSTSRSVGPHTSTGESSAQQNPVAPAHSQHSAISTASSFQRSSAQLVSTSIDEALSAISYEDVATIVRACDMQVQHEYQPLRSSMGSTQPSSRQLMSPAKYAEYKKTQKCYDCDELGHYRSDPECRKKVGTPGSSSKAKPSESKAQKKTLRFNHVRNGSAISSNIQDPLVDNGATYSGIGAVQLTRFCKGNSWRKSLQPIPAEIQSTPYWIYGPEEHSSAPRRIIGSVIMRVLCGGGAVEVNHLVIEGSTQWVFGGNVLSHCNLNLRDNEIVFPNDAVLPIYKIGNLSYVKNELFSLQRDCNTKIDRRSISTHVSSSSLMTPEKKRSIVDKVHKHVCGHSSYRDLVTLLQRNDVWDESVEQYLKEVVSKCDPCRAAVPVKPMRKVSISGINDEFNRSLQVDHLFLDGHPVLHLMEHPHRYSIGVPVKSTDTVTAIDIIETRWFSEFWSPQFIKFDRAFASKEFYNFLEEHDIEPLLIPARRHNKLALESKHKVLRDIYERLKNANPAESFNRLCSKAFMISNNLYGNCLCSAFESAKGYTRPICNGKSPVKVPDEIKSAQKELIAKRKLNLILRSKSVETQKVEVGDVVQVFIKNACEKRGQWSSPKTVIDFDARSGIVTVPGTRGRVLKVAVEDIRYALSSQLANDIQQANDELDILIDVAITEESQDEQPNKPDDVPVRDDESSSDVDSQAYTATDFAMNESPEDTRTQECANLGTQGHGSDSQVCSQDAESAPDGEYFSTQMSPDCDDAEEDRQGPWNVSYYLNLQNKGNSGGPSNDSMTQTVPLLETVSPGTCLSSIAKATLQKYYDRFCGKDFTRRQAEGLPAWILDEAYEKERVAFSKISDEIPMALLHKHGKSMKSYNIIGSHEIFKVKTLDDGSHLMRCRFAPHGNEDMEKSQLRSDSASCSPLAFRIFLSVCSLRKLFISKVDFKSAFLQTGPAECDVYVRPPKADKSKFTLWRLNVAAYGLVNANAKWQNQSDALLSECGLRQLAYMPQLFVKETNRTAQIIVIKLVDDLLIGGDTQDRSNLIGQLKNRFEVGTVSHTPGSLMFYGATVTQYDDGGIELDGTEKLNEIEVKVIERSRRKEQDSRLTAAENKAFRSTNGQLCFLGMLISPMAAFMSSHLQQASHSAKVKDMIHQHRSVKVVNSFGALLSYPRPKTNDEFTLKVASFTDAARPSERGQLGVLTGLCVGPLESESIFHAVSWSSSISKRPAKSAGAAEIMAAGRGADEAQLIAAVYAVLLGATPDVCLLVDSMCLWDSMSSWHEPQDRSIRPDVALLRHDFESKLINQIMWIAGASNPADVLTKVNSPVKVKLQEIVQEGAFTISIEKKHIRTNEKSLG